MLQDIINSVEAIMVRSDMTDALATTFIQQAQTRIERVLRVPGQETIGTITGNATAPTDQIVIPADFLALKFLYTPTHSGMELLDYKDLASFFKTQRQVGGIHPKYYTRVGGSFLIYPVLPPNANIWMAYYAAQPTLVNPTDGNFWTISCADLLTYGALSFACDYFVDDRTAAFEARFSQLLEDIAAQGRDTDWDQSEMAMSPAHTDY